MLEYTPQTIANITDTIAAAARTDSPDAGCITRKAGHGTIAT